MSELSEQVFGSIAGAFWFPGAICALSLWFGWTLLPGTRGRTLEEIGDSWHAGTLKR